MAPLKPVAPPPATVPATAAPPAPSPAAAAGDPVFPAAALGPLLGDAAIAAAAQAQAPPMLAAHHMLTLVAMAAQRLIGLRLPTGAARPVSCLFVTVVGPGEGRSALDRLVVETARLRCHVPRPSYVRPDLFHDAYRAVGTDRYRYFKGQSGLFTRDPHDVIQPGATRRAEAETLCAVWNGRVVLGAAAPPGHPRFALHLQPAPRLGQFLLGDADLADAGLLARMLVAAPPSIAGARRFVQAENDDPPPAVEALLAALAASFMQPVPAESRLLTFAPEAAARWLAYAREIEDERAPGGALAPVRAFAGLLAEHAARLAALIAFAETPDAPELGAAQLERGIALARFYAEERLRLLALAPPALSEEEEETLLREFLERTKADQEVTARELCRAAPKEIRRAAKIHDVMRRLELTGFVQAANPAAARATHPRGIRCAWKVTRADREAEKEREGEAVKSVA